MKVIVLVLSAICLSSARHVKWSPSDVDGHRDFKEEFHQFWSQLGDLLAEQDEQGVKEFLHQTFQIEWPVHEGFTEEQNSHHEMVKPNRPSKYHHINRPWNHHEDNIMRPLHNEDSEQQLDAEISRPIPPKPLRPNRPSQIDGEKFVKRPHDLPVEVDLTELEQSLPQDHIMRPPRPVEIEDMENVMRPLPLKPLRPIPNRPAQTDDDKFIMRPLVELPEEIDGEMEQLPAQNHIMRPVRPAETEDNVILTLPLKPFRPFPNHPANSDEDKFIMRPLIELPEEIEGEMEQFQPQNHNARPLLPVDV